MKNFDNSRLSKIGRIDAVELVGSYREMGWQYGHALKEKIHAFYDRAINKLFIQRLEMPYEYILTIATLVFNQYPDRFKEMIRGIGEGSGLGLDKAIILQQLTVLSEFAERKGCSNMVVWGDHSQDGRLVWGRTFDMPTFYRTFADFLTVITCRPGDSNVSATAILYAGQIDAYTVMNDRGLFISIDEAIISAGGDIVHDRIPVSTIPLAFALDYSDFEALEAGLNTIRPGWPVIITAGSKDRAVSFEYTTSECKKTEAFTDGVLVATNHFANPEWGKPDPDPDKGFTVQRRKNLLGAAAKYKGQFDIGRMKEVFDTPVKDGGVLRAESAYQLATVPADLKAYLKVQGYQDWVEIDLGVPEPLAETV